MRRFLTRSHLRPSYLAIAMTCLLAAGCSDEKPPQAPAVRSVKVATVHAAAASGLPLTGVVRQRQRAELAFENGGRLVSLPVDVGDTVRQGQVLAAVDPGAVHLRLKQAEASLAASVAQAVERQRNDVRQQQLYAQGNVAASVVEQARAAWQAAVAQQRRDQAALDLARRDERHGQIIAPFNGHVVARPASLYSELSPGQVVVELEASDDPQVLVQVPLEQAAELKPGDRASAYDPSAPASALPLILEGVSKRAQNGLLQTCRFRLAAKDLALPSGMLLSVTLPSSSAPPSLSIPVQALRLAGSDARAQVFVYDRSQNKVTLRDITLGLIDHGQVAVESGLADGEQVVTTGVAFLADGQAVSLFQPSTRLSVD